MIRKEHLQHTSKFGPVCQAGKSGAAIAQRGEHLTSKFAEFSRFPIEQQCAKCRASKLFAFLSR